MTATSSRAQFLPMDASIASLKNVDGQRFSLLQRRGSTPSLGTNGASRYFESLREKRRTSEYSSHADLSTPLAAASSLPPGSKEARDSNSSDVDLPALVARSILRTLHARAKGDVTRIPFLFKKRTMSLPNGNDCNGLVPQAQPGASSGPMMEGRERRASIRSQQLALLASQARLASSGTTNVNTALRAELAVRGAVQKVVNDVHSKAASTNREKSEEEEEDQKEQDSTTNTSHSTPAEGQRNDSEALPLDVRDSTRVWAKALATPQATDSFLDSASQVAHSWANGFYKYEGKWAEDALRKVQRRASEQQEEGKRGRDEDEVDGAALDQSASKRVALESNNVTISTMTLNQEPSSAGDLPTSLLASQKRLSASLVPLSSQDRRTSEGNGGQMVDVLCNFASLIEQRRQSCQGLEKLAQDAKRLTAVQLPSVSAINAKNSIGLSTSEPTVEAETDGVDGKNEDDTEEESD